VDTVTDARSVPVPVVAETLRISARTVWRMLARGELQRVKAGRATRVTEASLLALVGAVTR
jgi:excisionase family DNA binding protein